MGNSYTIGNRLLKFTLISLSKFSCFFPRRISLFFGSLFARFIYFIAGFFPYPEQIAGNIRITLPVSDSWARQIAKKHIIQLTKNIVEFMRFDNLTAESLDKFITIKNIEYFQEALNEDKGIIFISAHYGCWELIGAVLSLKFQKTLNVLVQKPANPVIDELFFNYREKVGIKTHYNNPGIQSLRPLFRALENKECLGFLIDQHGESEETLGEFFGKIVSIPSGPAHFSLKTGAPMVPVFVRRATKDQQEIIFLPPVHVPDGDKELEIYKVCQQLYKTIEKIIKDKPDEWLWMYERWNKLSVESQEIADNMKKIRTREVSATSD